MGHERAISGGYTTCRVVALTANMEDVTGGVTLFAALVVFIPSKARSNEPLILLDAGQVVCWCENEAAVELMAEIS